MTLISVMHIFVIILVVNIHIIKSEITYDNCQIVDLLEVVVNENDQYDSEKYEDYYKRNMNITQNKFLLLTQEQVNENFDGTIRKLKNMDRHYQSFKNGESQSETVKNYSENELSIYSKYLLLPERIENKTQYLERTKTDLLACVHDNEFLLNKIKKIIDSKEEQWYNNLVSSKLMTKESIDTYIIRAARLNKVPLKITLLKKFYPYHKLSTLINRSYRPTRYEEIIIQSIFLCQFTILPAVASIFQNQTSIGNVPVNDASASNSQYSTQNTSTSTSSFQEPIQSVYNQDEQFYVYNQFPLHDTAYKGNIPVNNASASNSQYPTQNSYNPEMEFKEYNEYSLYDTTYGGQAPDESSYDETTVDNMSNWLMRGE